MRNYAYQAGKLMLTILAVLATLELATRLFSRVPEPITQRDDAVGQRYRSSLCQEMYNEEAQRVVLMRTNQLGFRGPDWQQRKPAGVRRVAVLGDSYMAAEGLAEEQTFTGQLERMLRESPFGGEWQAMNFGVAGSSTGQQLALYRAIVSRFQPDIVVICFGVGTDVVDNSAELDSNPIVRFALADDGQIEQIPVSASRTQASQSMNRRSRLYVWQKQKINRLIKQFRKEAEVPSNHDLIYATRESAAFRRAWQLTQAELSAFKRETDLSGAQLVVVAIPTAQQIYADQWDTLQKKAADPSAYDALHPDQRLSEICAALEIPCLSMVDDFRRRTPSHSSQVVAERLFFNGFGHLNDAGHRAAAENVQSFLASAYPPAGELAPESTVGQPDLRLARPDIDNHWR